MKDTNTGESWVKGIQNFVYYFCNFCVCLKLFQDKNLKTIKYRFKSIRNWGKVEIIYS